jgi:hypothetical protein
MDPAPHVTTSHNKRRGLSLCMRGLLQPLGHGSMYKQYDREQVRETGGQRMALGHMAPHVTAKRGARMAFGGLAPKTLLKWVFMQQNWFFLI